MINYSYKPEDQKLVEYLKIKLNIEKLVKKYFHIIDIKDYKI